jgi:hypothetical protein
MRISVLDGNPVSVETDSGRFQVGPRCLGSQLLRNGRSIAIWAIVAISPDPLTPHRYLSGTYQTAEAAVRAFRSGFEVRDPAREPRLTWSKIVAGMLHCPGVIAN